MDDRKQSDRKHFVSVSQNTRKIFLVYLALTVVSYQNESFSSKNESCLACPHPPSSYGGRREQEDSSHFDEKTLILIGHYGKFYNRSE